MPQMKGSLAFVSLTFLFSVRTFACICAVPSSPCEFYASQHGQPTFVGVVVAKSSISDVIGQRHTTVSKITFQVEEAFIGLTDKSVDIYGEGTTCDFQFDLGVQYLVYGFREEDGKIRTSRCTRTAEATRATQDIQFLRSLPTQLGGKIFGVVVNEQDQPSSIGGTVTASGKDGNHNAPVTTSGKYDLNGLAVGDYRLTFTPPDNTSKIEEFKVSIPVNGSCANTGFRLGKTTVSGMVVDGSESPVSKATVLLFYALDGEFRPEAALKTITDRYGRFTFHRVEAAKFILSVKSDNSEMTSLPSTLRPLETRVLEIHNGDRQVSGLIVRVASSSR